MVTGNHYRWDFIGLSTDEKPTPESSHKVTDGSTFYCSDTSKLYVWYGSQWYERTAPGGGGISTDVVDSFWFGTQAQYDAIETKAEKTLYLIQEETATANTLSASPAVLTMPRMNLRNANTLNNVDNITPEEEIEEPEVEVEEEEPEEEENIESEE